VGSAPDCLRATTSIEPGAAHRKSRIYVAIMTEKSTIPRVIGRGNLIRLDHDDDDDEDQDEVGVRTVSGSDPRRRCDVLPFPFPFPRDTDEDVVVVVERSAYSPCWGGVRGGGRTTMTGSRENLDGYGLVDVNPPGPTSTSIATSSRLACLVGSESESESGWRGEPEDGMRKCLTACSASRDGDDDDDDDDDGAREDPDPAGRRGGDGGGENR
jgi:hypothetical protein